MHRFLLAARLRLAGLVASALAAALACQPARAADTPPPADTWVRGYADLRVGYETLELEGGGHLGLVGTSYLLELEPGVCVGPAVYGAASGQHGGLFTVGAEAAVCVRLTGPLSLISGLYVGGGGGGGAAVGGGLMLRPHVDLLWDFGGVRAGVSYSKVRFPSGQIDSNQFGLVVGMDTDFIYLPSGRTPVPYAGFGRTGPGIDRVLPLVGAYRPRAGATGVNDAPLDAQIGFIGARLERLLSPHWYVGLEANRAGSGDAAGYAEFLATVGAELPLGTDRVSLGGRVALGMGGGGNIPVGGGLLVKAAANAGLRLSRDLGLVLEAGWTRAPQSRFSAPYGSLALRWELDHDVPGPLSQQAREEWAGGIEHYASAARKTGAPSDQENVVLAFRRFVGDTAYVTGRVSSAYGGDAGGYTAGLLGAGLQTRLGERVVVGAELLAGAAGGGGVATGNGGVVEPRVYAGVELTRSLSLRVGAGRVKAFDGALDSTVVDLTLAFAFGVASRP